MKKDNMTAELLKSNYYALFLSIVTGINASKALQAMGLTEGGLGLRNTLNNNK